MKIFIEKSKKVIKIIVVVILAILCILSLFISINMAKYFSKIGELSIEYKINGKPTPKHHPLNIESIKPWMTFNYLNIVYKLNPDYLKDMLDINEPRYPNIRIDSYTRRHNINEESFINGIKETITNQSSYR